MTLLSAANGFQGVDEEGSNVDWLVMYKLPRESGRKNKKNSIIADGKVSFYTSCVSSC